MLGDNDAMATIAVSDLASATRFYGDTLGLQPGEGGGPTVAVYRSGGSTIVVYESEFAGTNQATSATWGVGDEVDAIVETLGAAGVAFEHYDLPGLSLDGDVHVADGFRAAWFRDPDGNILHINNL
jgi:catechol 2,3-dioxygenase-like lactoylglutathione lyase family enzyme